MSKHSTSALTMRDALYEAPGPKMRAKIRVGTAISLVAVAALIALVLQRFYVTGQLYPLLVLLYAPHHMEVPACRF